MVMASLIRGFRNKYQHPHANPLLPNTLSIKDYPKNDPRTDNTEENPQMHT